MFDSEFVHTLVQRVSDLGQEHHEIPHLHEVEPFKHFFTQDGELIYNELDEFDGRFTRREILARYMLLSVVLDQGPDIPGVRELLRIVTTGLYRQEVRIFHRPLDFFKELGIAIDEILAKHQSVKELRAETWATNNDSTASKYNLFFTQSQRGIISTKQVLDYAIHRWGVPLCVPLLLEKDVPAGEEISPQPLVDYLEQYESAEKMSKALKDNNRYGLGSAIGDKACHLYAKAYVSIIRLVKSRIDDPAWSDVSYEVPFDSNVGRVLFRTGFLNEWATNEQYEGWEVIQRGRGGGGTNYIRVTNIRGKRTEFIKPGEDLFQNYVDILLNRLKMGKKSPQSVEIQRLPNLFIYELNNEGGTYSVADFDDGMIYIGTQFCFNHENPKCDTCPLNDLCKAFNENSDLIKNYRT